MGFYGKAVRLQPNIMNTWNLAIADVIQRYTPENSGIVVFGLHSGLSSISPEIPYFSQRKGFTVPDWAEDRVENDPASHLGPKGLGAIVFCSRKNRERYNRIIRQYADPTKPRLFSVYGCYVWLPQTPTVVLADGTSIAPTRFIE